MKRSRIKQYLKDGRALRIETVVNNPNDLGVRRRLEHLTQLQAKAVTPTNNQRLMHHRRRTRPGSIGELARWLNEPP